MQTDTANVIEAVEAMTRAFHAGDLAGVMASYEPTATVVFEPGMPVSERSAQEAQFEALFGMRPRFTYGAHEVVVAGDLATHFAPWQMRATAPDGSQVQQHGLSVAVLRRQPSGRWLMVMDSPHGGHLAGEADPAHAGAHAD